MSPAEEDVLEAFRLWWVFVVVGLASLIAGVILVLKPSNSLATLAVVVGIFLLIDGIAELIRSFGGRVENRALSAIIGVLGVVIGIALIRHPFHGVTAIGLLIGIWLVAAGVVRLVWAIALARRRLLQLRRGAAGDHRRDRDRQRPAHRLRDPRDPDGYLADNQRARHDRDRCGCAKRRVRGGHLGTASALT